MFPTDDYSIEILYLFKLILKRKDSEEVPKWQSLGEAIFDRKKYKKRVILNYLQIFRKLGNYYKNAFIYD